MKKYKALFFDLDHTLWDYEKNSSEALTDLYNKYELHKNEALSLESFLETFTEVNFKLWSNYNKGHINRDDIRKKRFHDILKKYGRVDESITLSMSDDYVKSCPLKTNLFPYTHEVLGYLKEKYTLYILTNGFDDVQAIKITESKIAPYFEGMITSETTGHRKPSKEIFDFAVSTAKSTNQTSLMVGDNLTSDIGGAQKAEIDTVFFNPKRFEHKANVNHEISCLSQLMDIL